MPNVSEHHAIVVRLETMTVTALAPGPWHQLLLEAQMLNPGTSAFLPGFYCTSNGMPLATSQPPLPPSSLIAGKTPPSLPK
jgi:hypothetical protein